MARKSLRGFLLLDQSCVMWVGEKDRGVFRKKLGKKSIKVFGVKSYCCTWLMGMMSVNFGCETTMYFSHFFMMLGI
jgi:hypothetical protein